MKRLLTIKNIFIHLASSRWTYYVFFALLSLQVIPWFHGHNIINPSDFSLMLSPYTDTIKLWFRWDHTRGLGNSQDRNSASLIYTGILSLFYFLTSDISSTEKLLFYLWFLITCISAFVLISHFLNKEINNRAVVNLCALVGTLFYAMNPFLYNYRWGHGFLIAMFIYSIGPLLLYYLIQMLETSDLHKKTRYFLYFCIANLFAVPAFENPAYFLSFYSLLLPLVIIYWSDVKKNLFFYLKLGVLFVLVNLWWILRPLSFFESSQFMGAKAGVDNSNLSNFEFRFTSFLEVFRLQGFWATRAPEYYLYGKHYFTNPLIIASGYFLSVLALLFFAIGKNLRRYTVWFFSILVLIFLIKGLHEPAGGLFLWLIDHTPFRIFRFSMEKFYPLLILLFSIFISLTVALSFKKGKIVGHSVLIVTLTAIMLNAYPFLINGIIPENSKLSNQYLRRYYKIPPDYLLASAELSKTSLNQKFYILPENANSPSNSWTIYRWSGIGVDPLWNLLGPAPYLIANNIGNSIGLNPNSAPFLSAIYSKVQQKPEEVFPSFGKILSIMNSRYIVFRNDNINEEIYYNSITKKELRDFLEASSSIEKVKEWGEISLYKVSDKEFLPHFYVPKTLRSSDKLSQYPEIILSSNEWPIVITQSKDVSQIHLPKNPPQLEFIKISPVKYRVRVHRSTEDFPLVFSESFHKGWGVYLAPYTQSSVSLQVLGDYRPTALQLNDAATTSERSEYFSNGKISASGETGQSKFISKEHFSVIQNDNLPTGNFLESLTKGVSISNGNHFLANGYANGWVIKPKEECSKVGKCKKNEDGSYDLELIVEFLPQRTFYFGLFASVLSFVGLSIWITRRR